MHSRRTNVLLGNSNEQGVVKRWVSLRWNERASWSNRDEGKQMNNIFIDTFERIDWLRLIYLHFNWNSNVIRAQRAVENVKSSTKIVFHLNRAAVRVLPIRVRLFVNIDGACEHLFIYLFISGLFSRSVTFDTVIIHAQKGF